jgi:uncharacterized protein YqeY
MGLKEQLLQDLQQALRDHDEARKSAIRLTLAAVGNAEIARQRKLDDEQILTLIRREVKQHRESLEEFEKAGRTERVAEEKAQLAVLFSYLPQQLDREAIVLAAKQAIAEADAENLKQLGQVMRILMPRLQGKADGRLVNEVVRELLSAED